MTDNDIIKAWDKILKMGDAPIGEHWQVGVTTRLAKDTFDMLNRQKAEVERLKHRKTELQIRNQELQHGKSEAIKEFAEKLKNCFAISGDYLDIINIIDNLVKEMMGENENV